MVESRRRAPLDAYPTPHHIAITHRKHYVELRSLNAPPPHAPLARTHARQSAAVNGSWVEVMRQDYSESSYEGMPEGS